MGFPIDITGQKFGRLTPIKYLGRIGKRKSVWICNCDCGRQVDVVYGSLKRGLTQSCGCLAKEVLTRRNWKGGITDINIIQRNSNDMDIWRKYIFQKYNFTCVMCNKVGGKLNAHHLFAFSKYTNLRFNINNGICMCKNCHKEFHSVHGKVTDAKTFFEYYYTKTGKHFGLNE